MQCLRLLGHPNTLLRSRPYPNPALPTCQPWAGPNQLLLINLFWEGRWGVATEWGYSPTCLRWGNAAEKKPADQVHKSRQKDQSQQGDFMSAGVNHCEV